MLSPEKQLVGSGFNLGFFFVVQFQLSWFGSVPPFKAENTAQT